MSRIADDQRGGRQMSESDERLAERRAALRRAVSDLGDVTSRFRTRLEDSGHELPPRPAPNANGAPAPFAAPAASAPPAPDPTHARTPLSPGPAPAPGEAHPASEAVAYRDAALADARERFAAASRQADALVKTITDAVQSEARAVHADVEAAAEARFREIEVEAQRRLRRARAEADAMVEHRRRRIADVSDRILELGENLAARLEDADQVRGQFDVFVQALSQASDRLASESALPAAAAPAAPAVPASATHPATPNGDVAELSTHDSDAQSSGLAEAA